MKIIKQCEHTKKSKGRLPIQVYLAYLLVCTLLLTGISFSRYVSASDSADSARVAKGAVTVSYDENGTAVELIRPWNDGILTEEFHFRVSNSASEVAIRYDVVVTLNEALKNGVTMKLDGKTGTVKNDGKEYEFSDMGTFEAGVNETNTHTLSLAGDFDTILPGTDDTYGIQITIRSRQID